MAIAKSSKFLNVCQKISKISIYLLVFLLPIFFLPWTGNILDFNKQALLIFLTFICFFVFLLKALSSGEIRFKVNWLHIPLLVLFSIILISTIFSFYPYASFWGWPLNSAESLITLISLLLFYFLVSLVFEKKEIVYLLIILLASNFLAVFYGIFQLFGKFLLPFGVTRTPGFNTIGLMSSLAIFVSVLLPLLIIFITKTQKILLKIFFFILLVLDIFCLALVNSNTAWWLTIAGAVLLIIFMAQKRDILDNRWMALPMVILGIALIFLLLGGNFYSSPKRPPEVFLNQKSSFDIALKTIKDNLLFGTGPGTFVYNFSKYKTADFNKGIFWNIRLEKAGSEFWNYLSTTGVLGALAFLGLLIMFFVVAGREILMRSANRLAEVNKKKIGVKRSAKEAEKENEPRSFLEEESFLSSFNIGIFIGFVVLAIGFFLHNSNLTLNFLLFFLLTSFVSLNSQEKKILLKPSSVSTLVFTFVFTILFVFGLGVLILETQRYIASVSYQQGLIALQKGDVDSAINSLRKATRLDPKVDLYWRQLSQVYLFGLNNIFQKQKLSDEDKTRAQTFAASAVNSAKSATDTSSNNVANWSVRAFIYQNLIGVFQGTESWAKKCYDTAFSLEPANPYFPTQKGIVLIKEASLLPKEKKKEREKLLKEAEKELEKAVKLKQDYAPAHFQLAMIYRLEGKEDEAIKKLQLSKSMAPFDVGVAFQLGLVYYQKGDYENAKRELERAVSLDANYANALYFLGLTYDKLGEKKKAIARFETVQTLNPDNEQVKKILKNLKEGKPALEGLEKEKPSSLPIEEKPQEIKEPKPGKEEIEKP